MGGHQGRVRVEPQTPTVDTMGESTVAARSPRATRRARISCRLTHSKPIAGAPGESGLEQTKATRKRKRDATGDLGQRPRTKRRVRFSANTIVIGTADAGVDRVSTVPELFNCDTCGARIHAGLRGFDLYASCSVCSDFDVCLACCNNALNAIERIEAPQCAQHDPQHVLVLVDRTRDLSDDF